MQKTNLVIFTTDGATTDDIFKIPRKLDIFINDPHLGNRFLVSLVVGKGRSELCQIVSKDSIKKSSADSINKSSEHLSNIIALSYVLRQKSISTTRSQSRFILSPSVNIKDYRPSFTITPPRKTHDFIITNQKCRSRRWQHDYRTYFQLAQPYF